MAGGCIMERIGLHMLLIDLGRGKGEIESEVGLGWVGPGLQLCEIFLFLLPFYISPFGNRHVAEEGWRNHIWYHSLA